MASINVDLEYFTHPKTTRLVGLLGKGAEVLPLKLWVYVGKYHWSDGRLSGHTAQEIESIVGWWGKDLSCVDGMLRVGFLVQENDGIYAVKNWLEHGGHIAEYKTKSKKMHEAKRNRKQNFAASNAASSAASTACSAAASNANTIQYNAIHKNKTTIAPKSAQEILTETELAAEIPSTASPQQRVKCVHEAVAGVNIAEPDIMPDHAIKTAQNALRETQCAELYAEYPRKKSFGQAKKAIFSALKKTTYDVLLAGVRRYARERSGQDPTYTKHASTWFNGECWNDQPDAPSRNGKRPPSNRVEGSTNDEILAEAAATGVTVISMDDDVPEDNFFGPVPI